jgi:hypothetical protein
VASRVGDVSVLGGRRQGDEAASRRLTNAATIGRSISCCRMPSLLLLLLPARCSVDVMTMMMMAVQVVTCAHYRVDTHF